MRRKVNDKVKVGIGLLMSSVLLGLILQWFFQSWINGQSVASKWIIFILLTILCISGAILMIKGSTESTVAK